MIELYKKWRPKNLDGIVGQSSAVAVLQQMIENDEIPHAILLTGPSGCGKTTIARILRKHLKCNTQDFTEVNIADIRGIDNVRDIRRRMSLRPLHGKTKVWLLDECFIRNTVVLTPRGPKAIQTFKAGDTVYSAAGQDEVVDVFEKQIALDRLVRVRLGDGTGLYCSDHHRFYTVAGWKNSQDLTENDLILSFDSNIIPTTIERVGYEAVQSVSNSVSRQERNSEILQQVVCHRESVQERITAMPGMWDSNSFLSRPEGARQQEVLQQIMPGQEQDKTARDSSGLIHQSNSKEDKRRTQSLSSNPCREGLVTEEIYGNAEATYNDSGISTKSTPNKTPERDSSYLEREEGGQRDIHQATTLPLETLGQRLDIGIADQDPSEISVPNQLQSGYREPTIEDCRGSGRHRASFEEEYAKRCQETTPVRVTGVESVTRYQSTNRETLFDSVVSHTDAVNGFITLYDLQVKHSPTYFVGFSGVLVHNCHKLSGDAQTALLKMLEDTPKHVYFMLATTDPHKLLKTIRTRCTEIALKPIGNDDLAHLLAEIILHEKNRKITDEVIGKIVESSDGSARKALVLLGSIIHMESEEAMLEAIEKSTQEAQTIQLCRMLLNPRSSWSEIAKLLKELEGEEPEGLRRMVLGYMRSVLLGGGNLAPRAGSIIGIFERNFFDSLNAGLALACWEAMGGK